MKDKKLLLIVLVMVLFVSIGKETYALFTNEVSSIVQSYSTGTLKLSYSNTSINLDNAYPLTDKDGMNQDVNTITITNIGTLAYKFNVIIDPSSDSTISSDLIRVSIDGENPATLSSDGNIIIRDVILNPGSSRTFTIKLWINSNASSSDILNKKFSASLTSTGIAVKNVEDSDGIVLAGSNVLYDIIKKNADTTAQIDFSQTSVQDSTNGIYTTTDTEGNAPVYYYRGNVDNHVIFANSCWRIVRTTETGGVKLIYDGVPTGGQCNNTGDDTTIGNSAFNPSSSSPYVGYMYGSSIDDATYTDDSIIKGVIDDWYKTNMTSYTSQLEDTVFCNDRSYTTSGSTLYFGAYTRLITNKTPTLKCQNTKDKFTVDASNGNGALTYPVGLITADEMAYAGGVYNTGNSLFYLYTGKYYWTLSPHNFRFLTASGFNLRSAGDLNFDNVGNSVGVRPSVSLQPGIEITGGSGTATDPFVIAKLLYNEIKENADTTTQIDFSKTSEQDNTNGIYMTTDTDSGNPVYYYRGNVDNHVIFANFCWRIVRTTDTGGVKLIYDGVPTDGQCNNTGSATTIGKSTFNSRYASPADVGYMYGTRYTGASKTMSSLSGSIVFGNDITYANGTYTLKDTYTLTDVGNWSSERSTIASKYHYTCFTSSDTCKIVGYIHYINSDTSTVRNPYYFGLISGKNHLDILKEMLDNSANDDDSTIKTTIDTWYQNNMTDYTSKLEDTVFCNDRSYDTKLSTSGWNKDYSNGNGLYFNSFQRVWSSYKPTLVCTNTNNKFTVEASNGNGALDYPVGLLTADEMMYAGAAKWSSNSSFYLYTGQGYWALSPNNFSDSYAYEFILYSTGNLSYHSVNGSNGVRPVLSLQPGIGMTGGSGTATDPFIVN